MKTGVIIWANQKVNVHIGKKIFDKEYSFWGYQCFPILDNEENKKHSAKWLFEKDVDNRNLASINNNGFPVLFINENDVHFLS